MHELEYNGIVTKVYSSNNAFVDIINFYNNHFCNHFDINLFINDELIESKRKKLNNKYLKTLFDYLKSDSIKNDFDIYNPIKNAFFGYLYPKFSCSNTASAEIRNNGTPRTNNMKNSFVENVVSHIDLNFNNNDKIKTNNFKNQIKGMFSSSQGSQNTPEFSKSK